MTASTASLTLLSEGKTKQLFVDPNQSDVLLARFKDQATAFNAQKVATIAGKGELNAAISAWLFRLLEECGLTTCFLGQEEAPDTLRYKRLTMIPVEVVVRNVALGSLCKRFPGITEGTVLEAPLVEFFLKDDAAGDPPISESLMQWMGLLPDSVTPELLQRRALQVNEVLNELFAGLGITCADFKLEFGLDAKGLLCLADELSPDSFRLREKATGRVLDKDVFRLDLGDLKEAYEAVWQKLQQSEPEQAAQSLKQQNQHAAAQPFEALLSVQYRPNVLHPASRATLQALQNLGFQSVKSLKEAKRFALTLEASSSLAAEQQLAQMAEQILSNPVIEGFAIEQLRAIAPANKA